MRCRFPVYCIYSFYAVIVYAFVAHWVWAKDGWLAQLGAASHILEIHQSDLFQTTQLGDIGVYILPLSLGFGKAPYPDFFSVPCGSKHSRAVVR